MNQVEPHIPTDQTYRRLILACGLVIWILLAWITWMGPSFRYEIRNADRPIVLVTSLFVISSLVALFALWISTRVHNPRRNLVVYIFLFSIAFRLVQLFSPPFQEIDSYRYIWDGIVVSNGHSPYRFSPSQVINEQSKDQEFNAVKDLAFRSSSTTTIVSRIHFPEIRTLYPPVSQAVFAMTMLFVPVDASVTAYVFAIKVAITLFDLGVLFLLAYLLAKLKLSLNWCIAYGWNPLIVKEFSNSGHLDSIAVFMVMLSLVFLVNVIQSSKSPDDQPPQSTYTSYRLLCFSAIFLALGFGAKIYPMILAPFFFLCILKKTGWGRSSCFAITFCITSIVVFSPMAMEMGPPFKQSNEHNQQDDHSITEDKEGLTTFLKHWQINEMAYMLVYQNLREIDQEQVQNRPWFRFQNEPLRTSMVGLAEKVVGKDDAVHYLSRLITLGSFLAFYVVFAVQAWRQQDLSPRFLLETIFWIIAIFFCLQPTQNPWYWTWAIPLLPFVNNRAWMIYSPFLFTYYLRFWFSTLPGEYGFMGCNYTGKGFFDYVIVWLEHMPVLAAVFSWWLFSWAPSRKRKR